MNEFKIMAMRKGNPVTVKVNGQVVARGTVESWANHPGNGGFNVVVALDGGGYDVFWVREGATFWH